MQSEQKEELACAEDKALLFIKKAMESPDLRLKAEYAAWLETPDLV